MRRLLPVLVAGCALALAVTALASDPTGFFSQLPGHGGCITDNGNSNGAAADCADGRGLSSGESIALTPDGRFLYLYSYAGGITMLSRDTTTGAISQADDSSVCIFKTGASGDCGDGSGPSTGGDSAHALAVVGGHIYTAGRDDGMVSIFDRSVVTGALSEASCLSVSGNDADGNASCTTIDSLDNAQSLAVSPDGKFLYVGGYGPYGLSVFSIGLGGELTPLGSGDGCHVAVDTTGCTTSRLAETVYDIALSPDGSTLYAANYNGNAVLAFSVDSTTGALTQIAGTGGCFIAAGETQPTDPCTEAHGLDGPGSVEVSPDGKLVSVASVRERGLVILRRASDGTLSQAAGAASCVNETSADGCGSSRETQNIYRTLFSPDSGTLITAGSGDDAGQGGLAFFDIAADGTITQRAGTRGCISDTGFDSLGAPGSCAAARGIDGPVALTMTADGRWLYAVGNLDAGVAGFRLQHPPACADASASTAFGTAVTIPVTCTDSDGDSVTLAGVDGPAHGSVSFSATSATYTPAAGFSGADSLRVRGSDGISESAPATVSVTVGAGPPPPPPPAGKKAPLKLSLGAKPTRDRTLPFRFTFSGTLTPAAGTTCSGKVVLTVKRGRKTVAKKTATLASSCKWKAVVKFANRRKLGRKRSGKLVAKARFAGSSTLDTKLSKALAVRYG